MPRPRPPLLSDQVLECLLEAGEGLPLSEIKYRLRGKYSDHWVGVAVAELVQSGRVVKGTGLFRKALPRRERDQVQEYQATIYSAVPPALPS